MSAAPAISAEGAIYVGSNDDKLYAVNPDGTMRWSFNGTSFLQAGAAIGADGTIYFASHNGKVFAVK